MDNNLPQHIAIIMDGNRRWAKKNGMDSMAGHKEGTKNLEIVTKYANKIGIKYMTVYAFSTENWKRDKAEVKWLMNLLKTYLKQVEKHADSENMRLKIWGDTSLLDKDLIKKIDTIVKKTENNTGLTLNVAFNYGGRNELLYAMKKIATYVKDGSLQISDLTEQTITDNLYSADTPDPDLLIRTSGEQRLSNFLPWQLTYSEFYFSNKHWPEFKEEDLNEAIKTYQNRIRKFGGE